MPSMLTSNAWATTLKHFRRSRLAPAARDSYGDVTVKAIAMAMEKVGGFGVARVAVQTVWPEPDMCGIDPRATVPSCLMVHSLSCLRIASWRGPCVP